MLFDKYKDEFSYNLKLATPVVLGMLGHTFVAFIDNVMVGQLGAPELAAVSLGNSFVFIAMSLGIGFSTAITPLVAEADTENNSEQGHSVLKHGLVLCTVLGLSLFVLILIAKPLLYFMDQPEEVVVLAKPYLDFVAFSLVPLIVFQAFKQFSDGLSLTKYPMYATILANLLNVLINYLLIFGKFGFPQLGIVGAAIGTLISRVVMLVFLWYLLSQRKKSKMFLKDINFKNLRRKALLKIINLGFPSAMQMFFEVSIFTAAIWLSGTLGTNAQAANQIALNLSSMTFMVAMGLGVAAMIRVGNQKGLKDYINLKRIAESIFLLGFLFSIIFAVGFTLLHDYLPHLYLNINGSDIAGDTSEVFNIASNLLLAAAIFQISDGLQVVVLGALRGLQDVYVPTLLTFIAYWVIGFPISYFLGQVNQLGSLGIWIGLLAGLTAAALFLYFRFQYLTKRLILKQQNERP